MKQILKVLVGSHAHGLATPDSDRDYRGVFVLPTEELLTIGTGKVKGTHWVEGDNEDDTAYELAHFLHLATKSNPTILEVFAAPVVESTPWGEVLRALFPYVWSARGVRDAFIGYSLNQRKKMLDDKPEFARRKWKYATAYIRTLIQGTGLLKTGVLDVVVPMVYKPLLADIRAGLWTSGRVLDYANFHQNKLLRAYGAHPARETNLEPINQFILSVRKEYWND